MQAKFVQEHYMRAVDVDINGQWMPSAILVRMQEIAEDHATATGLGRVHLIKDLGIAWVLTRLHLKMYKYPLIGQTIKAMTWPNPPTKMTISRQFQFETMDGVVLGGASTQWILFDIKDRVLRRMTAIGGDYPAPTNSEMVFPEPKKLKLPKDMAHARSREVTYSEVDMNGHLNNSKYANWMCELYDNEHLKTKSMKELKINFIAEPYLGQNVDISTKDEEGVRFVLGQTNGKVVFDGLIDWY